MAAERAGPVSRTNGAGPRRIKKQESVASNPFRGGVSLGGIAARVVPSLSQPPGTPSATRPYIRCLAHRYSFYFLLIPFLFVGTRCYITFPLFFFLFADRVFGFFFRHFSLPAPPHHCGYLRSNRSVLGHNWFAET